MSKPELLTPIRLQNAINCPPAPARRRLFLDEEDSDDDYSDMPPLIPISPPVERPVGMRITPQSWSCTDKCNDQCNEQCVGSVPCPVRSPASITEILDDEEEAEEEAEEDYEHEEAEAEIAISCNRLMTTNVSVVLPAWAWMSMGFLIAGIVLYKI